MHVGKTPLLAGYVAPEDKIDKEAQALIQKGHDQVNIVMARMKEFYGEMIKMKQELDAELGQLIVRESYALMAWLTSEIDCRKRIVQVAQKMNDVCHSRADTYPTIEKQQADVERLIAQIKEIPPLGPVMVQQCDSIVVKLRTALDEIVIEEARARVTMAGINFQNLSGIIIKHGIDVSKDEKQKGLKSTVLATTIQATITARFKPIMAAPTPAAAKK